MDKVGWWKLGMPAGRCNAGTYSKSFPLRPKGRSATCHALRSSPMTAFPASSTLILTISTLLELGTPAPPHLPTSP